MDPSTSTHTPAPDPSPVYRRTHWLWSQPDQTQPQAEGKRLRGCGEFNHSELQDLSGLIPGAGPPRGLIWHWVSWEGTSSSSQVGLKMGPGPGRRGCVSREMTLPGPLGRERGEGWDNSVLCSPLKSNHPVLSHPLCSISPY